MYRQGTFVSYKKNMSSQLTDEELNSVTGGSEDTTYNTGDVNSNGEVYFAFPSPITSLSGWYSQASLEKLCSDNIGFAFLVRPNVTQEIRNAAAQLYGNNIPASVKTMLG